MDEEIKKTSEDLYADIDFDDENEDILKDTRFIDVPPKDIKFEENKKEILSKFFGENDKLVGERIIEKKSGEITEIKYDDFGKKVSVVFRGKDKKVKKSIDYYESETVRQVTNYAPDGTFKAITYNIDGSKQNYLEKHEDGSADAVYFNVDGNGAKLIVKLDENRQVIEKHVEK
ncbi:MAG: hypothetical protein LUE64_04090 [Candidatus Gastranaerophilales bacterium]|nr:hypothetical protein [Candidatus Gastranaerophilales bacterium]